MPKGDPLSKSDVSAIKWRLHLKHRRRDIARDFDVVTETIAKIARGDTWPSIPMLRPGEAPLTLDEKLDAEILAPANLEALGERLLAIKPVEIDCPGCRAGWPLDEEGFHKTRVGVPIACLRRFL